MVMLENVALNVGNVWNVAETITPHEPAPPPRRAQNTMRVLINRHVSQIHRTLTVRIFHLIRGNEGTIGQNYCKFCLLS
jgi:hypothetical protein